MGAIELGTGLDREGYNMFVLGPTGTGRHSFVRQYLEKRAAGAPRPSDWCYVNNFSDPRRPAAIELPAGDESFGILVDFRIPVEYLLNT